MRRKELVCKIMAAFLSAVMTVTCVPVNNRIMANAAETEQAQNVISLGSVGIQFLAGEYSLPVALMKSIDITSASMAGSCME